MYFAISFSSFVMFKPRNISRAHFGGRSFTQRQESKSFSSDVSWEEAKPYAFIPGPKSTFEVLRLISPGGRYHNLPFDKITSKIREDYGTISKFPGFLGLRPTVMTFLPEDTEKVFRNEGKFPFRRPLDSLYYFRKQHRPDLYPGGAGLVVT